MKSFNLLSRHKLQISTLLINTFSRFYLGYLASLCFCCFHWTELTSLFSGRGDASAVPRRTRYTGLPLISLCCTCLPHCNISYLLWLWLCRWYSAALFFSLLKLHLMCASCFCGRHLLLDVCPPILTRQSSGFSVDKLAITTVRPVRNNKHLEKN